MSYKLTYTGQQVQDYLTKVATGQVGAFIAKTEDEMTALLKPENVGALVSYMGEGGGAYKKNTLYMVVEEEAPEIAVGDTIDKLYFNTSVEPDLSGFVFDNGVATLIAYINDKTAHKLMVYDLQLMLGLSSPAYCIMEDSNGCLYSTTEFSAGDINATIGWQNLTDGAVSLGATYTVNAVNQQDLWSSYISKEPFTSTGGGIIAKPACPDPEPELPVVTASDSGKFLRVDANGKWTAQSIPYAEEASF